jgi:hypothetical protein
MPIFCHFRADRGADLAAQFSEKDTRTKSITCGSEVKKLRTTAGADASASVSALKRSF